MGFVNALDFVDTFQFDDQLVLDENVDSVSTIEPNILVLNRQSRLELKGDSVASQFMGQALFVGRFKQSQPEVPVDFDSTTDTRFESSSNSIFVLFVLFVVAVISLICTQRPEWRLH